MKQTEKPFEVGGQRFTAVRFQAPRPHWRVRLDETGEILEPGTGGIPTDSLNHPMAKALGF